MKPLTLLALLLVSACSRLGPEAASARTYVVQLAPLLDENALLADQMGRLAGTVHDGSPSSAAVIARWEEVVVPLAFHLRDQAVLVQPPVGWGSAHETLVTTWTDRADAYLALSESLREGDLARWRQARQALDRAMLDEERWFRDANGSLRRFGLHVDQFP